MIKIKNKQYKMLQTNKNCKLKYQGKLEKALSIPSEVTNTNFPENLDKKHNNLISS
jgi:hypothetical protein